MVGLSEGTGKRDSRNPVGDVAVGDQEALWPFSSNSWSAKHRLQSSKAMGLFGGSCFNFLPLFFLQWGI